MIKVERSLYGIDKSTCILLSAADGGTLADKTPAGHIGRLYSDFLSQNQREK